MARRAAASGTGSELLHWQLGKEEVYGVGFVSQGQLVVAAGPPTPAGVMLTNVASYTLEPGKPLEGRWAMPSATGTFPETLTKVSADHPAPVRPPQHQPPAPASRQRQL